MALCWQVLISNANRYCSALLLIRQKIKNSASLHINKTAVTVITRLRELFTQWYSMQKVFFFYSMVSTIMFHLLWFIKISKVSHLRVKCVRCRVSSAICLSLHNILCGVDILPEAKHFTVRNIFSSLSSTYNRICPVYCVPVFVIIFETNFPASH